MERIYYIAVYNVDSYYYKNELEDSDTNSSSNSQDFEKIQTVYDVSNISIFTRNITKESFNLGLRVLIQKADKYIGKYKYKEYLATIFKKGRVRVGVISSETYPNGAMMNLLNNIYTFVNPLIEDSINGRYSLKNNPDIIKYISDELKKSQNPEPDKITKVQSELDEIKKTMVTNIEKVIDRGEKIDNLIVKSQELSDNSKLFYKKTKKLNRCCIIL